VLIGAVAFLQFGQVNNVIIPRPTAPGTPAPSGLGKVIVEFADDSGCTAAYRVLNGRRFGGRTVVATYLPEQSYMAGQFDV
jgi:splicing factor U2AF subunit